MLPAQEGLDASALPATHGDDRLVVEQELIPRDGVRKLAFVEVHASGWTGRRARADITPSESGDDSRCAPALHAVAASCLSVIRRARPPSRSVMNT